MRHVLLVLPLHTYLAKIPNPGSKVSAGHQMGYLMASNQPSEQMERVDGWVRWYLMASNQYQISPSGHMSYERASESISESLLFVR